MFSKVLIANRGEIALRIIRACKELGVRTVAVYSEADADSLHVHFADEIVCIGPGPSSQSYLNIARIISAAEVTDADAVHPGYGFLAENAHFAEVCEECRITFIGPSSETIRLMGDKSQARKTMRGAGVAVIPGSNDIVKTQTEAINLAKKIGYPVMVKAAAGGGGKGIRIAHTDVSLASAFYAAQAEAEKAFGNRDVYLEKCLQNPKHIEFQILSDKKGNVIHLGERDCSIQRRHQKLIEETPCPVMDERLREDMGRMAVKAARAVNYVGAGTIEFLLHGDRKYYFMEMNTRIQVEHPITEMVTDVDIIREQILAAAGEELSVQQKTLKLRGHAIECRINAEDPDKDFMPSPGKVHTFYVPGGPGVRVDTHVYEDYVISPYYDSMIAKLIVKGTDRVSAINRMKRALDEFIIEGVKTTVPFHKEVLQNPYFLKGDFGTDFIEVFNRTQGKTV